MKVTIEKEISFFNFEAWSGAVNTLKTLMRLDELVDYDVEQVMENYFDEVCITDEGAINDFLWFDDDYIATFFDFEDWEALEKYVENSGLDVDGLIFNKGDEVMYIGDYLATITEVDKHDKELPYRLLFENRQGEMVEEWAGIDEVTEVE